MPRVLAALAALLVLPGAVRAQETKAPSQAAASPTAAPSQATAASPETDPKVQAAIQKAVDKAKEDLRNEMRAELQGAQSAAEFMGTVAEQPKTQLLELDGYYRLRGQLLDKLNLRSAPDSAGFNFFPKPLRAGSIITNTNMRLRLEPTINASETVRVRAQIDVLDNYVLGSNTSQVTNSTGSPYPLPFYGSSRSFSEGANINDRPAIIPRRLWGEVQTPIGLLSFGRMPSSWGLGILANDGKGLDQDYGDSVDRIQFALAPVTTPIGELIFIPIYDFDATGPLFEDPHAGAGVGQPLTADRGANARTLALKAARLDDDEEIRRKLERGEQSINYGFYYNHRNQRYVYPAWLDQGFAGTYTPIPGSTQTPWNRRSATANVLSLWSRWLKSRFRVEGEAVLQYADIGNANATSTASTINNDRGPSHIHARQWGFALQTEYKQTTKLSYGLELGAASGDGAPGFGNLPDRGTAAVATQRPNYGAIDGPQWGRPGDNSINNFRFNPAYQVDEIFYRRIIGNITDSVYLRPSVRWDIVPGLVLDGSALYAQAQVASSTPSSASIDPTGVDSPLDPSHKGKKPLALEFDTKLSFSPTRAFTGWMDLGLLKPLSGMGTDTSIAWLIDFGLAARF
jgi:uncharacterized protein (TIGR04551 family)